MLQIIKDNLNINFAGHFVWTSILSVVLVCLGLSALLLKMNYGVDFRGGAELQVKFDEEIDIDNFRKTLKGAGLMATIQRIGEIKENEYLLKVPGEEDNLNKTTEALQEVLLKNYSAQAARVRKVDIVGPKAGAELRMSGFQAMLWALLAIMIYLGLRFDFKYSPGAIVALFHDVSIILGVFAFLGLEFTLQIVAALLAVIGYSVNDTVIVYDRVREHEKERPEKSLREHINSAINQTLSRTALTSGTTLFVSITMLYFGGLAIRDFFLAISLGVIIGTYSSIYVAAPVTLLLDKFRKTVPEQPDDENIKA